MSKRVVGRIQVVLGFGPGEGVHWGADVSYGADVQAGGVHALRFSELRAYAHPVLFEVGASGVRVEVLVLPDRYLLKMGSQNKNEI